MNFEGSKLVLEGQKIDKREKKDNAGKNNEEAIDLKRRGFLKLISGAAVTAVVGTTAFKIAENVLDLDEEKVEPAINPETVKEDETAVIFCLNSALLLKVLILKPKASSRVSTASVTSYVSPSSI